MSKTNYDDKSSSTDLRRVNALKRRAAEMLLGMILFIDVSRVQVGLVPSSKAEVKARCQESVEMFLAAYGTK